MSTVTLFPAIFFLSLLSGCVAASETLSGSETQNGFALNSSFLDDIKIGVTTKEEVRRLLGNPTDVQVSSEGDIPHESWAYVSANVARQPFQYLPIFGALAITKHGDREPFAVSFSPEGIVDGLTVSQVHAQGNESYDLIPFSTTMLPIYGMMNPLVQSFNPTVVSGSEN